jgi:hypothetical protein
MVPGEARQQREDGRPEQRVQHVVDTGRHAPISQVHPVVEGVDSFDAQRHYQHGQPGFQGGDGLAEQRGCQQPDDQSGSSKSMFAMLGERHLVEHAQ